MVAYVTLRWGYIGQWPKYEISVNSIVHPVTLGLFRPPNNCMDCFVNGIAFFVCKWATGGWQAPWRVLFKNCIFASIMKTKLN